MPVRGDPVPGLNRPRWGRFAAVVTRKSIRAGYYRTGRRCRESSAASANQGGARRLRKMGPPCRELGSAVATIFDETFGLLATDPHVPLTRIDISGYGASIRSDWINPAAQVVASHFDGAPPPARWPSTRPRLGRDPHGIRRSARSVPGCQVDLGPRPQSPARGQPQGTVSFRLLNQTCPTLPTDRLVQSLLLCIAGQGIVPALQLAFLPSRRG